MKNKDFDNIDKLAQDAFEHFEVPFNSGDWMAFQDKLDNESVIDAVAKDALANYEIPLDPHGWDEFEQLHQRKKGALLYIWWYKAAEMGAMALLLLATFLNLPCSNTTNSNNSSLAYGSTTTLNSSTVIPSNTTASLEEETLPEQLPTTTASPIEQVQQDMVDNNATYTTSANSSLNKTNNAAASSNAVLPAVAQEQLVIKNNTATAPLTTATKENDWNSTNQNPKAANSNPTVATTPLALAPEKATNITTASSSMNTINKEQQQLVDVNKETQQTNALQLEQLLAIQSQHLQLPNPAKQQSSIEPITTISSTEIKAPYTRQHYLGAVLGVGANMGTSMGKTSIGYSGGITYEKEFSSKVSLSVGLLGSYKRYDRTDVITLDQSVIDGKSYQMTQVKTSNLSLLEIPVDVHYTCFRSDKWRIYAHAGLSLNGIFSRIYTGSQEVQVDGLTISTELNSSDFERGLVEGGEAMQNIYLSVGAGVGVERKLGDNLSLYLLPTYRHGINQVHSDLIHTFNVNIGIKKAL